MEKRELTCIGCPLGCSITVTLENGEIKDVTGYTCKRGHDYARKEVTNPTRIVTSTVRLTGSATGAAVVSCKTAQDIPKGKIFEIVVALRQVTAHAPVKIGDVLRITFGAKTLAVEVLAVAEAVRKDDASAMYRELAE